MTRRTFEVALAFTLRFEGGFVDHPSDPGGVTNHGITWRTLRAHRGVPVTRDDVRTLSRAEAASIYHARYWTPLCADELPAGVDLMTFDFAVNSGVSRAATMLQGIVGALPDGMMGPATLSAVADAHPATVIRILAHRRLAFMQTLKTWPVFGRGWRRRVVGAQRRALALAAEAPSAVPLVSRIERRDLP